MKKIIWLLTLILFSISVSANNNWWQEANADYLSSGGNSFIAYGSNFAGSITDYEQCSIGINTNYNSIAGDFALIGYPQIVTYDTNTVTVYNTDCSIVGQVSIGATIQAQPVIMNTDGDSFPEILILTSTEVKIIKANFSTATFEVIKSISTDKSYEDMTCLSARNECYLFNEGDRNVSSIYISNNTIVNHLNLLTYLFDDLPNYSALSNIRFNTQAGINWWNFGSDTGIFELGGVIYYTAVCGMTFTTNSVMYCNILKNDVFGVTTNTATISVSGFDAKPSNLKQVNAFIAQLGTSARVFITACDDVRGGFNKIYDLSGNLVYSSGYNAYCDDGAGFTNWAIADYNKDGANEACYATGGYSLASLPQYLYCLDSFGNFLYNTTIGTTENKTYSLSLIDFNSSKSTLGVVFPDGVYYPNSTGELSREYFTGLSRNSNYAKIGVTFTSLSAINGFWISGNNTGILVYPTAINVVCGDNVCSGLENSLVCPQDCSINATGQLNATGFPCINDSDCTYGKCLYNACTLLNSFADCEVNNDCISGSCTNGKCAKASLWTQIDYSKTDNFGNDSETNNFLSILIMIIVMAGLSFYGIKIQSAAPFYAGIIAFFALGIFFGVVGWLSPFLVFGMLIVLVAIVVFMFMMGGSSN
jgi:hypothetical protein